jgi:hypothetical protein
MATEFYKSIPEEIKGKLDLYCKLWKGRPLDEDYRSLVNCFTWNLTPEGYDFWENHEENKTFPQWSDELNRFIDPPQVNTITVNADEYQAMREVMVSYLKDLYPKPIHQDSVIAAAKRMGIDINEITN